MDHLSKKYEILNKDKLQTFIQIIYEVLFIS
jgi:hypothetical protein